MSFILALDQGTSSSRALVFDHDGTVCGLAQKEIRQIFPEPGFVEHDAEEIWASQLGVAVEAIARAGLASGYWQDRAEIGQLWQAEQTIIPAMERDRAVALRHRWSRALERSKGWELP
jgi:glycerol kinase